MNVRHRRPTLQVVHETAAPDAPLVRGGKIARLLRLVADVAESGSPWEVDGHDRDPIFAAVVVVFSADGEPTPFVTGVSEVWKDRDAWSEVVHDAKDALNLRHDPGYRSFLLDVPDDADAYDFVRANWLRTMKHREDARRFRDDRAEELAREFPFLCDCGKRCKSAAGLTRHRQSRRHRVS